MVLNISYTNEFSSAVQVHTLVLDSNSLLKRTDNHVSFDDFIRGRETEDDAQGEGNVNTNADYHITPINDEQSTGFEALPIALGNQKQMHQTLQLLRATNYYLTEKLHAKILQYKLDDLTLISGYEWGDEEDDPYVMPMPDGTDGRLSHIVAHSENQARRDSNATNIRWIKSMNKELRGLLSELIEVESDEGLVMLESMQMEYTSYNLQLKLYSLETLSQDVQDLITDELLKMENRVLVERVKGMISYLRLRLIWEERVRKTGRRDLERVLMLPPRRG